MTDDPNALKFTPEEETDFSSLTDDEIKNLERLIAWRGQKAKSADPGKPPLSSQPSDASAFVQGLTLGQLKAIAADPEVSSTLRSLWDQAAELLKGKSQRKPAENAGVLRLIRKL